MYVKGYINQTPIKFLIDSGATATLISKSTFDRLKQRPLSERNVQIQGVDGGNINVYGRDIFRIGLGK